MVIVNVKIITSKTKQKSKHLWERKTVENYWNENGAVFSFNYYTPVQKMAFGMFVKGSLSEDKKKK